LAEDSRCLWLNSFVEPAEAFIGVPDGGPFGNAVLARESTPCRATERVTLLDRQAWPRVPGA